MNNLLDYYGWFRGSLYLALLVSMMLEVYLIVGGYLFKMSKLIISFRMIIFVFEDVLMVLILEEEEKLMAGDTSAYVSQVCVPHIFIFLELAYVGMYYMGRWKQNHLSNYSVKECMDNVPTGICFYEESGKPLFFNYIINDISRAITGEEIKDGNYFWKRILDNNIAWMDELAIVAVEGIGTFGFRQISHDNMTEINAMDISDIFELNKLLEKENQSMKQMNKRLREYGSTIEDTTRQQEILDTKIRVHDDTGSILLATKHLLTDEALINDEKERKIILESWKKNIHLLTSPNSRESKSNVFEDLQSIAKTVGVEIVYRGTLPLYDNEASKLIANAVHECLTNTVSHGEGKTLFVESREYNGGCIIKCYNDGIQPEGEITEGGGLSNLRKKIEAFGGSMKVGSIPQFNIEIKVPVNY